MTPVRVAICRAARPTARRAATVAAAPQADLAPAGVSWLKFGDDMVYCGASKPVESSSRVRASRARPRSASIPTKWPANDCMSSSRKGGCSSENIPMCRS